MTAESSQTSTANIGDAVDRILSEDELRYQSFIDNNVNATYRIDFEEPIPLDLPVNEQVELLYRYGCYGEVNQTAADLYGFDSPAEVIGLRLEEFLPRDLPTSIPLLTRLVEAKYYAHNWASVEQDRYGNKKVFLNNNIGEIKDGMLLRWWGTAIDITQQKQLEEQANLLSTMFEQIPEGCVIVEEGNENIAYLNTAFTSITGYTESDMPGNNLSFLQGVDTDPDTVANIREAISQERTFQGEILNYKKDGTPFWNQMRISPIKDANGVVTHYVGILRDITEKKRNEAERHEQRNELMHLARVTAMGELTAALAHELNQPLTAILSNAQAAQRFLEQDDLDLDELREILKDIVADDKRAGELMHRIRRLVKRGDSKFEQLNINHVIGEVLALIGHDLVMKQVRFRTELAPNLPALQGDPVQLQQVILNLIINACHAMQDQDVRERLVSITTQQLDDSSVEVVVTDSGQGIDEKIREKIFQPFYTTKKEGMGMGLAINRTIIESHGGRLWAENRPEQGAVFHITLPLAQ